MIVAVRSMSRSIRSFLVRVFGPSAVGSLQVPGPQLRPAFLRLQSRPSSTRLGSRRVSATLATVSHATSRFERRPLSAGSSAIVPRAGNVALPGTRALPSSVSHRCYRRFRCANSAYAG